MRKTISNRYFNEENALDHIKDTDIISSKFAEEDSEEGCLWMVRNVSFRDCGFSTRYPLWIAEGFTLERSEGDENARSAFWYAKQGIIADCDWKGPKALRECRDVEIRSSRWKSDEFGWRSEGIKIKEGSIESDYLFLGARNVELEHVQITGKYSFQYMEDLMISDCKLDTKDALWHSRNVTVKDSVLKGVYCGWFSEGLTLVNCHIRSYMPFFSCKNLKLIDCTMEDAEMCFLLSEVDAHIKGHINSYYEPLSGSITCDSAGKIIKGDGSDRSA